MSYKASTFTPQSYGATQPLARVLASGRRAVRRRAVGLSSRCRTRAVDPWRTARLFKRTKSVADAADGLERGGAVAHFLSQAADDCLDDVGARAGPLVAPHIA